MSCNALILYATSISKKRPVYGLLNSVQKSDQYKIIEYAHFLIDVVVDRFIKTHLIQKIKN